MIKAYTALIFLLVCLPASASGLCRLDLKLDEVNDVWMGRVVPALETDAEFACESAILELVRSAPLEMRDETGRAVPVLYVQKIGPTDPFTISIKDLLDAAIPRLIVLSLVDSTSFYVRAIHVRYMDRLDRVQDY
jgi:hypothetical protein